MYCTSLNNFSCFRRDSGYSTASESGESAPQSPQNIGDDKAYFFSEGSKNNFKDSAPLRIEVHRDHEVNSELFSRPTSASIRLSDSSMISDSDIMLSAGATNNFEESVFENQPMNRSDESVDDHSPWCISDRSVTMGSHGLNHPSRPFAAVTNTLISISDTAFTDGTIDIAFIPIEFPGMPSTEEVDCPCTALETVRVGSCNWETNSSTDAQVPNQEMQGCEEPSDADVQFNADVQFDADVKFDADVQFDNSAGVANLDIKPTLQMSCKLNAENFELELSKFLQRAHVIEKFKLTYEKSSKLVSLIDLMHQDFRDLVNQQRMVTLTKIVFDTTKSKKFASLEKKKKRSLASCQSVPRGLALAEKFSEIQRLALDSKTKNNRFTNYQRRDRNSGKKLEKEFLEKNGISRFASYSEIERQCMMTLAIFDSKGSIKYLSSKLSKKIIFFYEGEDEIYFVKNLKGFCRIE